MYGIPSLEKQQTAGWLHDPGGPGQSGKRFALKPASVGTFISDSPKETRHNTQEIRPQTVPLSSPTGKRQNLQSQSSCLLCCCQSLSFPFVGLRMSTGALCWPLAPQCNNLSPLEATSPLWLHSTKPPLYPLPFLLPSRLSISRAYYVPHIVEMNKVASICTQKFTYIEQV